MLGTDTERALAERARGVRDGRVSEPSLFARRVGGGVVGPERVAARGRGFQSLRATSNRRTSAPELAASVDAPSPSAPGVSHGVRHVGQCLECSNHCFAHLGCIGCAHVVHRIDSLRKREARGAQISFWQGRVWRQLQTSPEAGRHGWMMTMRDRDGARGRAAPVARACL